MVDRIDVRFATRDDAPTIARHRAEMFRDMGQLPDATLYDELLERSVEYLVNALATGEYVGWLASHRDDQGTIVAGAGVQRRRTLPHPQRFERASRIAYGRRAIVLNVFTERSWRRRGLARLLMTHIIEWARQEGLDTLVLHASGDGRSLYESLGFAQTSEMRYIGRLSQQP